LELSAKYEPWFVDKEGIAPLIEANKLGCILFQFPSSFKNTPEVLDLLKSLLEAALHIKSPTWLVTDPLARYARVSPSRGGE
jgi:uncharacterized protein YecE (DUF72 family)